MNVFFRLVFLFFVTLIIAGCSESSSDKAVEQSLEIKDDADFSAACEALQEEAIRISVDDFSVIASDAEYKLYLEGFFNALSIAKNEELTSEEQSGLNAIVSKINEYLHYQIFEGVVIGANNPLDFFEKMVSSSALSGQIQVAKEMLAAYIKNGGDGFCIYKNRDIIIGDLEGNDLLSLQLNLTFDPFNNLISQTVIMAGEESYLERREAGAAALYTGYYQAGSENFSHSSYTLPAVRLAIMRNTAFNESLVIGGDNKHGLVEFNFENSYCDQEAEGSDPSNYALCADDIVVRLVQKEQCDGSNESETDEVNKLAMHSFDFNANFTNIKRMRVDTDYVTQSVRIFFSQYNEAIYDSDGISVIADPTNCEKKAVLDELFEASPDLSEGVRLTIVPDPNYDIQYALDENGAPIQDQNGKYVTVEPTPAIQF